MYVLQTVSMACHVGAAETSEGATATADLGPGDAAAMAVPVMARLPVAAIPTAAPALTSAFVKARMLSPSMDVRWKEPTAAAGSATRLRVRRALRPQVTWK
ncbi:hypothetical protein GCM10010284_54460 [Streptomyces rubiginosohelvolus]|nr:hypothetical protein GCM10010284_54460 [Streptomyces rubiginosohelvolus]